LPFKCKPAALHSGKLNITKDKYELEVPVSKSGVNKDDIKLTMKWSMEM
jgi:hypothetical protein